MSSAVQIHPTAVVDAPCTIGAGTRIWHFSHVCAHAMLGENCNLGQNVMIASGVRLGANVKIQNNVSVYAGTTIEDAIGDFPILNKLRLFLFHDPIDLINFRFN